MSESNFSDDTQPNRPVSVDDTQQTQAIQAEEISVPEKPRKSWRWILGGLLAVILIGALGGFGGYSAGIAQRKAIEKNNLEVAAALQFQLGISDFQAGRYEFAKQRFDYVLQLDPGFPGIMEALAKVAIVMNSTATPTVAPSATPAPTLDLSGVEALLAQAKGLLAAQDWNGTLNALDTLRKQNPSFRTLEIDGMYYKALRFRGIQKILQVGNLEGGIYDFALMKLYGPEDGEVKGYTASAVLYLNAAKYWKVDWKSAVQYLAEVYQYTPGLMDGSSRTAADRYREAMARYADDLLAKEKWCTAVQYYEQSFAIGVDKQFQANYTKAHNKCLASQPTEVPTIEILPTDPGVPTEPTAPTATDTPPDPTAEPTAEPTAG